MKQKSIELKSRLDANDFKTKTDQIHKFLLKGNFVNVTIKMAKHSTMKDAEGLKIKIEEAALEWSKENPELEVLAKGSSRLIINIK